MDPERVLAALTGLAMPPERPPLYGDGRASERIAEALVQTPPAPVKG
jgi:hypothetical protein